jgi:hypothetical protein
MRLIRLAWLSAVFCAVAAAADYEISDYTATFTLIQGSPDVRVELDITYHILAGTKADGFKYVGDFEPFGLQGTDGRGNSIPVGIKRLRENQVYWIFPEAGPGYQRVVVTFGLRSALEGKRSSGNTLDMPWVGVFRVPVRRAVYKVVFPPGLTLQVSGARGFSRFTAGGSQVLSYEQEPLTAQTLDLSFTPGIADGVSHWARSNASLTFWIPLLALSSGLVAMIVVVIKKRREGYTWGDIFTSSGQGGASGGWAGGGCGGGGCGGGGCGGGCGG